MFLKGDKYINKKTGEIVEAVEKYRGTMNINHGEKFMPTALFELYYELIK